MARKSEIQPTSEWRRIIIAYPTKYKITLKYCDLHQYQNFFYPQNQWSDKPQFMARKSEIQPTSAWRRIIIAYPTK